MATISKRTRSSRRGNKDTPHHKEKEATVKEAEVKVPQTKKKRTATPKGYNRQHSADHDHELTLDPADGRCFDEGCDLSGLTQPFPSKYEYLESEEEERFLNKIDAKFYNAKYWEALAKLQVSGHRQK